MKHQDLLDAARAANTARKPFARREPIYFSNAAGTFLSIENLSRRQRETLQCLMTNCSNKEAGEALGISHRTIETHREEIVAALGCSKWAEVRRQVMYEYFGLEAYERFIKSLNATP